MMDIAQKLMINPPNTEDTFEAFQEIHRLRAENESLRKVFDAAENLVKVKGRFHSEQAYGRLVTAVAGMKVEE